MRASISRKFVFLANTQCASTSVRRMLDLESDIKGKEPGPDGTVIKNHVNASDMYSYLVNLGEVPSQYFFFTTVRNPWDRMVSRYYYGRKNTKSVWNNFTKRGETFSEFIRNREVIKRLPYSSYENFAMIEGRDVMDDVIKVESFEKDVVRIFNNLNIKNVNIRKENVNRDKADRSYRKLYCDEGRKIVEDAFKTDIYKFGYEF